MKDDGGVLGWLRRLVSGVLGLGVNTVGESRTLGEEIARGRETAGDAASENPPP